MEGCHASPGVVCCLGCSVRGSQAPEWRKALGRESIAGILTTTPSNPPREVLMTQLIMHIISIQVTPSVHPAVQCVHTSSTTHMQTSRLYLLMQPLPSCLKALFSGGHEFSIQSCVRTQLLVRAVNSQLDMCLQGMMISSSRCSTHSRTAGVTATQVTLLAPRSLRPRRCLRCATTTA